MPTPDTFEEKKITQIDTIFPHLSQQRIDGIGFSFAREAAQNTRNEIIEFLHTTIAEARAQGAKEERDRISDLIASQMYSDYIDGEYVGLDKSEEIANAKLQKVIEILDAQ